MDVFKTLYKNSGFSGTPYASIRQQYQYYCSTSTTVVASVVATLTPPHPLLLCYLSDCL
jgi:hypothetical protein